jgi:hypothetical protein
MQTQLPILLLFSAIAFALAYLWIQHIEQRVRTERFQGEGEAPAPWDKPPIESVPIDLKLKSPEHQRAFYAVEDNAAFEQSLQTLFGLPVCVEATLGGSGPLAWTADAVPSAKTPTWIVDAFGAAVASVTQKFTAGSATLPDMQVLDERWIAYRVQGKPSDAKAPLLLRIEMVLYREASYHAKHVELWVLFRKGTSQVLSARVLGILFEDTFALFPRLAATASEKQSAPAPVPATVP